MYPSNPTAPEQSTNASAPFVKSAVTAVPAVNYTNQYNVNSQPAPFDAPSKGPLPWSSGLYDFWDDVPSCCMTAWLPCITFGRITEILDKGQRTCGVQEVVYGLLAQLACCGSLYSYPYRSRMRQQFALEESPCGDCMVHFCCEPCALCQEYRELQSRGFDMTLSWQQNVEHGTPGAMAATAPKIEGGMSR